MVQRVCDQLVDIHLSGWWWGKWESALSSSWFQSVWGLHACGEHTVNFSHLGGWVSVPVNSTKILLWVSLEGAWDSARRLHYLLFLDCSFLVSASPHFFLHPLPSLVSNCLNLPLELSGGHEGSLFPVIKKWLLCLGAPEGPAQFQCLLFFDTPQSWGEQVLNKKGNNHFE